MYKSDYDSFVSNPIWREIEETSKEVKRGLVEDLINMDPIAEASEMSKKQGRLKMLDWLMAQPLAILEEVEANKLKEERKESSHGQG
jgi:hypothetical protein